jgi:hypothetical protein
VAPAPSRFEFRHLNLHRIERRSALCLSGKRNLGTFASREAAEKHERAVQFFKRRGG